MINGWIEISRNDHTNLDTFRYVPAAVESSRNASNSTTNGEKSAAVSGGGFGFHDMFEHAHNIYHSDNNGSNGHQQHQHPLPKHHH